MRDKALLLLILMIMKQNGDENSRDCSHWRYEWAHTNEIKCRSPTPDFDAFKWACTIVATENRHAEIACLPVLFLQNERDEKDEPLLLKFTGVVELLLVELDEARWRYHLIRENSEWVMHTVCALFVLLVKKGDHHLSIYFHKTDCESADALLNFYLLATAFPADTLLNVAPTLLNGHELIRILKFENKILKHVLKLRLESCLTISIT